MYCDQKLPVVAARPMASAQRSKTEAFDRQVLWNTPRRPLLIGIVAVFTEIVIVWALQTAARQITFDAVVAALHAIPPSAILASLTATVLSYIALFGYDLSGLRYARARPPISIALLASFCGYAIGNSVGLGMFSGGAVRYRVYTAAGLTPTQVARVILFISAGFAMGICAVACIGLLVRAGHLSAVVPLPALSLQGIAALLLALILAFLVLCSGQKGPLRWGPVEIELPGTKLAIAQIVLALVDILAASAALWALLPTGSVDFLTFSAVFAVALGFGVLSHVPGGLGVFELTILSALDSRASTSGIAAALVVYRVLYFGLPLLLQPFFSQCLRRDVFSVWKLQAVLVWRQGI